MSIGKQGRSLNMGGHHGPPDHHGAEQRRTPGMLADLAAREARGEVRRVLRHGKMVWECVPEVGRAQRIAEASCEPLLWEGCD